jgi:hypothetical protein
MQASWVIACTGSICSHIFKQVLGKPVKSMTVFDKPIRGTRHNLEQAFADPRVQPGTRPFKP